MPPQIPRALLRSAPSANMFMTMDSAAGSMSAAPTPWTPRMTIRKRVTGGEGAGERGPGEHREPGHEQAPAAQEVSGPPAEQQQPAEGEPRKR